MTKQADDYMHLGRKRYTLIDIEKDKQIIDCAEFVMPYPSDDEICFSICSACWRGYTADYYIVRNTLYGAREEVIYGGGKDKVIKSPRTFIPFTGSCVIARGGDHYFWHSDFLDGYAYYDEAFELYFKDGILKEKLSLADAIEKVKAITESGKENANLSSIILGALKYQYGESTYKWRNEGLSDE